VKLLLDAGADVNACTSSEATPMHIAACSNSGDIIRLLVAAGGDARNNTAYKGACVAACLLAPWVAVSNTWHFRAAAASANHILPPAGTAAVPAGETPLTCAAYCGHYDAVKALVEAGHADVNMTRQDGTTPLNLAAYADAKTALLLLAHGAHPDGCTSKSSPFPVPLVMSAARGDVELCARLIEVRRQARTLLLPQGVL
jgi:ankyrin repeat protein